MKRKPQNRTIERVAYRQGQMLRSSDFRDIQHVADQRRWWHNRAMHNTYGVYQGLEAIETGELPPVIQVKPGVAYDCFGRELLLECLANVGLPPASQTIPNAPQTLLVRYHEPQSRSVTDPIKAICCFADGGLSAGTVEFVWSDSQRIAPQDGVPIGRLLYVSASSARFVGFQPAPRVRAFARPRLATGSSVAGNTTWRPWDFEGPPEDGVSEVTDIGVQTTIDTSAAGFTEVPQYFAWLRGPIWNAQAMQLVPALLPSIANESLTSFTFRLALLPPPPQLLELEAFIENPFNLVQSTDDFFRFAQQQQLYVTWLGCQMPDKNPRAVENRVTCTRTFQAVIERGKA